MNIFWPSKYHPEKPPHPPHFSTMILGFYSAYAVERGEYFGITPEQEKKLNRPWDVYLRDAELPSPIQPLALSLPAWAEETDEEWIEGWEKMKAEARRIKEKRDA